MSSNISVVVNYKESTIFASNDAPDAGYVQFTKSGDMVFITVDGKSVGFVPVADFAVVQKILVPNEPRRGAVDV